MAARIDRDTLTHVAALARLDITPDEEPGLLDDLQRILDYVARLSSVDTSGVVLQRSAMETMREDTPVPGLPREQALADAPCMRNGFVVVHDVMGGTDEL